MERDRKRTRKEQGDGARRSPQPIAPTSAERVIALQRAVGNHAVERLLSAAPATMVQAMRRGPLAFPRETRSVRPPVRSFAPPGGQPVRAPSGGMEPQSRHMPPPVLGSAMTSLAVASGGTDPFAALREPTATEPGTEQELEQEEKPWGQRLWDWIEWLDELEGQLDEWWREVQKLLGDPKRSTSEADHTGEQRYKRDWRFRDEGKKEAQQAEAQRWAEFEANLNQFIFKVHLLPVIDYDNDDASLLFEMAKKAHELFKRYAGIMTNIMLLLHPGTGARAGIMAFLSLFNVAIGVLDVWIVSEPPDPTKKARSTTPGRSLDDVD